MNDHSLDTTQDTKKDTTEDTNKDPNKHKDMFEATSDWVPEKHNVYDELERNIKREGDKIRLMKAKKYQGTEEAVAALLDMAAKGQIQVSEANADDVNDMWP